LEKTRRRKEEGKKILWGKGQVGIAGRDKGSIRGIRETNREVFPGTHWDKGNFGLPLPHWENSSVPDQCHVIRGAIRTSQNDLRKRTAPLLEGPKSFLKKGIIHT